VRNYERLARRPSSAPHGALPPDPDEHVRVASS